MCIASLLHPPCRLRSRSGTFSAAAAVVLPARKLCSPYLPGSRPAAFTACLNNSSALEYCRWPFFVWPGLLLLMFGADGPVILQLLWPHFSSNGVTLKSAGALALNCLPLLPSCGQYLSGLTFLASLNSFSAPEQMLFCFFLHSQVALIRLVDHISRCWAAALLLAPATPAVPLFFSGYQWGFPDRDDADDHDDHNDHFFPCARIAWHLPPLTWGSQLSLVVPWTNSAGLVTAGTTYIASDSYPLRADL